MSDKPREVMRDHAWKMLPEAYRTNVSDEDAVLEFLRAYERMRFEEECAGAGPGATGA